MDFYQGTPNLPMTGGDIFTDITTDIATLNNTVVFKAGTQTITGDKTLSGTTTITGTVIANALTITPTELGYIDGLTSNAQTQLNDKVSVTLPETISGSKTFSGTTTFTNNIVANALTITPTELGFIDGLTSNAQTQLNDKVSVTLPETISGSKTFSGTTTFTNNIVANALTITPTELGYIDGLTSNAQTQINDKVSVTLPETISGSKTFSGTTTFTNNIVANALTITPTELGYIDGLTSNAQTQLNGKVSIASPDTITGAKTFSTTTTFSVPPVSATDPSASNQVANKSYVDAAVGGVGAVTILGNQTITGDKIFSGTTTFTGDIVANSQTITPTELGYIATLTSDAQTQITARALDSAVVHLAGVPETISSQKTFTTTLTVDTANRDTILQDTGISTSHPASGTSFSVNSTDLSSINATNTLSAGTVNSLVNTGLAVGSTAIANSISTTGGYNRITSGTSSTLANEITATGGGGNSMTTAGAGATAVRSLGTGTAIFSTNSGKNTIGSTSGQVEISTNSALSDGILIKNMNIFGGILIESDGASGSLNLDSAGTLNANTNAGKLSLTSTTGQIELTTAATGNTGINIENTSTGTGGITIKTAAAGTGDIVIDSGDAITVNADNDIVITTAGTGSEIKMNSASTSVASIELVSAGGIVLQGAGNTNVKITGGANPIYGVELGDDASVIASVRDGGMGVAGGYFVGALGALSNHLVFPLMWMSTSTGGQTTSQCRVGSFPDNNTAETFIRYRLPYKARVVAMTLLSDGETVNANTTYIHMSVTNTTGLDLTPAYSYWIYNAGAGADDIVVSSNISSSVVGVADIPANTTFYVFLAFGSAGATINVVGTARTVPSEFQVHLYCQQVS
jgi:hypothetical protein